MKLTRSESNSHARCMELLKQETLTDDEKEFILINFHEGANNDNSSAGAFFTPVQMAFEFAFEAVSGYYSDIKKLRIIDLCAGIGCLSYAVATRLRHTNFELVCVEYNHSYYEVGKRIVPEAKWINGDATDLDMLKELGQFDICISNPPFGNVATLKGKETPNYKGSDAEYKIIDIASCISDYGVFLIPQGSSGFAYSGQRNFERQESSKYKRFVKQTGLELDIGMGVDTSHEDLYNWEYSDGTTVENRWKGVNPVVEFACCEFGNYQKTVKTLF